MFPRDTMALSYLFICPSPLLTRIITFSVLLWDIPPRGPPCEMDILLAKLAVLLRRWDILPAKARCPFPASLQCHRSEPLPRVGCIFPHSAAAAAAAILQLPNTGTSGNSRMYPGGGVGAWLGSM